MLKPKPPRQRQALLHPRDASRPIPGFRLRRWPPADARHRQDALDLVTAKLWERVLAELDTA